MGLSFGTFETILLAEMRVGLPPLFYTRLLDINDHWGFVLKLQSFFEGTLTKLLQEKLALRPNLREGMTQRDSFVSRVHLAERMGLIIDRDYRAFLLALNRLRNDITHNIRFIDFDLQNYVDSLSDSDFRRSAAALAAGFKNLPLGDFVAMMAGGQNSGAAPAKQQEGRAREADLQLMYGLCASFPAPQETRRHREQRTAREFFWHFAPKLSLWYAGVWALDLLSLHFHFEPGPTPGTFHAEADMAAKVQDLLLDPAVLEYKRKLVGLLSG